LPIDAVTADKISNKADTKETDIDNIEEQNMILDIGKNTVKLIKNEISKSKTVFWNGPLGVFETSPFDRGTVEIAKFISNLTANNKIRSFAGGGDTISALDLAGVKDNFSYVSTGGGALLELIEGKKLPGLVALGIL
jgi:phosphoglycerate kinase